MEVESIVLPQSAAAPEAAAAAEPAMPVTAETAGIYLQLGAFSAHANAESFREKIQQQLSWLNQRVQIQARGKLFRLRLGPYRNRNEANAIAEKIRAELDFRPLVLTR